MRGTELSFNGDEAQKSEATRALAAGASSNWLSDEQFLPDRAVVATSFGLSPAFSALLYSLAERGNKDGTAAYFSQVIEALPVSVSTDSVVRDWLLWVAAEPSLNVGATLAASSAQAAADAIVQLHQCGSDDRNEWRNARRNIAAVQGLSLEQEECAEIVAAMAWSVSATPGVAADVLMALQSHLTRMAQRRLNWLDATGEQVQALHGEFAANAMKHHGVNSAKEATPQQLSEIGAEIEQMWEASGKKHLMEELRTFSTAVQAESRKLAQIARDGLLTVAKAAKAIKA